MTPCLDIHTHHPAPQPLAVVSASLSDFNPLEGQLYSLGIHPWESAKILSKEEWNRFEQLASLPSVVAIGECGVDKLKGVPLFKQLILFQKQIELSEKLKKPLIIHDVKAHDVIVGLKRDLNPAQKWLVHGLRAKPTVAKMLTDVGIFISFGEKFNPQSLLTTPPNMILAETDESSLSIQEIILNLSEVYCKDLTGLIESNTASFLYPNLESTN